MKLRVQHEGQILDEFLWRSTGRADAEIVNAALEANRGLAAAPIVLPLNTEIDIPDSVLAEKPKDGPAAVEVIDLWT